MMELKIADWFRSTSAIAMLQQQRRHQTSIAASRYLHVPCSMILFYVAMLPRKRRMPCRVQHVNYGVTRSTPVASVPFSPFNFFKRSTALLFFGSS